MSDSVLWEYLEGLSEQENAWCEWKYRLTGWHHFETFYTHYLKIKDNRAKFLECTTPCECGCPRQVLENSPYNITAVCMQRKADPISLKFRDILIYSLRREAFHQALCSALQIANTSGNIRFEFGWYIGDYHDAASKIYYPAYLTYRSVMLPETISTLCQLHHEPFVLMTPTMRITLETQQLLADNNFILLSMVDELTFQPDGTFSSKRSISECMRCRVKHNFTC